MVHFTKPESINSAVNVAFEVTDPATGENIIQAGEVPSLDLYNWFVENGLLHAKGTAMRTPGAKGRRLRSKKDPTLGESSPSLRNHPLRKGEPLPPYLSRFQISTQINLVRDMAQKCRGIGPHGNPAVHLIR